MKHYQASSWRYSHHSKRYVRLDDVHLLHCGSCDRSHHITLIVLLYIYCSRLLLWIHFLLWSVPLGDRATIRDMVHRVWVSGAIDSGFKCSLKSQREAVSTHPRTLGRVCPCAKLLLEGSILLMFTWAQQVTLCNPVKSFLLSHGH